MREVSGYVLSGIGLVVWTPLWIAGYIYHLRGYRPGGRYGVQ